MRTLKGHAHQGCRLRDVSLQPFWGRGPVFQGTVMTEPRLGFLPSRPYFPEHTGGSQRRAGARETGRHGEWACWLVPPVIPAAASPQGANRDEQVPPNQRGQSPSRTRLCSRISRAHSVVFPTQPCCSEPGALRGPLSIRTRPRTAVPGGLATRESSSLSTADPNQL